MLSAIQQLISGTAGGPAAGETIIPGSYNLRKNGAKGSAMSSLAKGSQPFGQASAAPTMNLGAAAAAGGGGGGGFPAFGGAPAAGATPNSMGTPILHGNIKSPLQPGPANIARGGKEAGGFGGLFGGRRRKSRRSKKAKKTRKGKGKRKSHRRRR